MNAMVWFGKKLNFVDSICLFISDHYNVKVSWEKWAFSTFPDVNSNVGTHNE